MYKNTHSLYRYVFKSYIIFKLARMYTDVFRKAPLSTRRTIVGIGKYSAHPHKPMSDNSKANTDC